MLVDKLCLSQLVFKTLKSPFATQGQQFFTWAAKNLPEIALRLASCVKKNDKEVRDVAVNLFTDIGMCFGDAKGSIMYTTECMLKNGVARLLNAISVGHKVTGCTFKNKSTGRLCVSITQVQDEACPFAVGI